MIKVGITSGHYGYHIENHALLIEKLPRNRNISSGNTLVALVKPCWFIPTYFIRLSQGSKLRLDADTRLVYARWEKVARNNNVALVRLDSSHERFLSRAKIRPVAFL